MADQRARGAIRMVTHKGGQKKKNNGTKRNENEQAQIDVASWFAGQKKQARKKLNQTPRKAATRQNKKQAVE